jgi:hypothetical protein
VGEGRQHWSAQKATRAYRWDEKVGWCISVAIRQHFDQGGWVRRGWLGVSESVGAGRVESEVASCAKTWFCEWPTPANKRF